MEENYYTRALSSAIAIFLAGVISATAIWAVRRFMSPKAAFWLTTPIGALIRRLVGRERKGRLEVLPSAREAADRLPQHREGRD